MRIQFVSDLHLEFRSNLEFLQKNKLIPLGDFLILAGDIFLFHNNIEKENYFDFLSDNFQKVFWLPGNHEYYYSDIIRYHKYQEKQIRHNIEIVKDKVITIEDTNLIFTTLWSNISPANEFYLENQIADFKLIKYNGTNFKASNFNALHESSKSFLQKELKNRQMEKNIVITHHVPTFKNYPKKFKSDPLNEAFAVEMYELIEKYKPETWIYGHSHVNIPAFSIGKTNILTNQLGYVDMGEHKTFNLNAFIEL